MNTFLTNRIPGDASTKLVAHLLLGILSLGLILHATAQTNDRAPETHARPALELAATPAPMIVAEGSIAR